MDKLPDPVVEGFDDRLVFDLHVSREQAVERRKVILEPVKACPD